MEYVSTADNTAENTAKNTAGKVVDNTRPGRGAGRAPMVQHLFAVVRTELVAPQLMRVYLGGDAAFDALMATADPKKLASTDKYIKLIFARPELGLAPPYDLDVLRTKLPMEDLPVRRTYTVRDIDVAARTLAVDFVVHGDEGLAGPWAARAQPGDVVAFYGPGGLYHPSNTPGVSYLYAGDDSAIPALAAALEQMNDDAQGLVLIEVEDSASEMPLARPDGVELRWVHRRTLNGRAHYGTALVEAVQALARPAGEIEVFAHGEREAIKQLRPILQGEWGLDRRSMSLSAYWAYGRSEDGFQAEKTQPVGKIFED